MIPLSGRGEETAEINRGEAKGIKRFPLMGRGQRAHKNEDVPGRSGMMERSYSKEREVTMMLDTKNKEK